MLKCKTQFLGKFYISKKECSEKITKHLKRAPCGICEGTNLSGVWLQMWNTLENFEP